MYPLDSLTGDARIGIEHACTTIIRDRLQRVGVSGPVAGIAESEQGPVRSVGLGKVGVVENELARFKEGGEVGVDWETVPGDVDCGLKEGLPGEGTVSGMQGFSSCGGQSATCQRREMRLTPQLARNTDSETSDG